MSRKAFAPILLERKAARLRKELELNASDPEKNGNANPQPLIIRSKFDNADRSIQHIFAKALMRPFKLWYCEPIVQLLGIYMAFVYGLMYCEYLILPHLHMKLNKNII